MKLHLPAAALCALLLACDPVEPPPPLPQDPNGETSAFVHTEEADGTVLTVVDATSEDAWRALDLDKQSEADKSLDEAWDVAFQRFRVHTRGGVNGSGGVKVARLEKPFAEVTSAPAENDAAWREDGPDGDDPRSDAGGAFEQDGSWYSYNFVTHKLTARDVTYVIRTDEGRHFKIAFSGYYDSAGTPGVVTFRWSPLPG